MINDKTRLDFTLVFSEACLQLFFYLFVVGLLKATPLLNVVNYFVLAAVLTAVNLYLSSGRCRRLTIVLINILLLGLGAAFVMGPANLIFFARPAGLGEGINYGLAHFLILWLGFRSLYLVFKGDVDFYLHMDFNFFITLLLIVIADYAQIPLPGAMAWLVATVFFNLLPLFILQNIGEIKNGFSWILLFLMASIILGLSAGTNLIFPHFTDTAGTLLDILKSGLNLVISIFTFILLALVRWANKIPPPATPETQTGLAQHIGRTLEESTWAGSVSIIWIWILTVILLIAGIFLFFYSINLLISWLWQRREGSARGVSLEFSWSGLLLSLRKHFQKAGRLLSLCLPTSISIYLAYMYLLWWGAWKNCPRHSHETPHEYFNRLAQRYPEHSTELKEITDRYAEWRYSGNTSLTYLNMKPLVRKLYKPRFAGWKLNVSLFKK